VNGCFLTLDSSADTPLLSLFQVPVRYSVRSHNALFSSLPPVSPRSNVVRVHLPPRTFLLFHFPPVLSFFFFTARQLPLSGRDPLPHVTVSNLLGSVARRGYLFSGPRCLPTDSVGPPCPVVFVFVSGRTDFAGSVRPF